MAKIIKEILARESCLSFSRKPVPKTSLTRILQAARWAPSARNLQPWRFIVIDNTRLLEKARKTLSLGHEWAREAPVLVAVVSKPDLDIEHRGRKYYLYDCGAAVMNLSLQAESEGLKTHQILSFDEVKLKEILQIPEDFEVLILIALGFAREKESLLEKVNKLARHKIIRSRARKPLSGIAFRNGWRKPLQKGFV